MLSQEELERRRRRQMRERRRRMTKRRKRQERLLKLLLVTGILLLILGILLLVRHIKEAKEAEEPVQKIVENPPDYEVDLLEINEYSRPGLTIDKVNAIVIHYTANPGTSAQQNRDYFNGLKDSKKTKASAHFVVGLEGEIVQCIPCNEMAYASNDRNGDTIAIECCHPEPDGKFNQKTRDTLVHLTAWLLGRYGLTTEDVIRHYDVSGKKCPLYYVENPEEWQRFLKDVDDYILIYGKEPEKLTE